MNMKSEYRLRTLAPVLFLASLALGHSPAVSAEPVKLIYDGDIGPDPCDFSTLSMLHQYHNKGMIDLIGVIGSTPDRYVDGNGT